MPQMAVSRPFGEFDLGDEAGLEPLHFGHLLKGHAFAPVAGFAARQIGEGAGGRMNGFLDDWMVPAGQA